MNWTPAELAAGAGAVPGPYMIVPDRDGIAERLQGLLTSAGNQAVILGRNGCDTPGKQVRAIVHLGSWPELLTLAKSIPEGARVWIVTRGGQSLDGDETAVSEVDAMMWGAGRTWAAEFPAQWGGLIDLDPDEDAERCAHTLAKALDRTDREDQTAHRKGKRFAARMNSVGGIPARRLHLREDAAYLVTGGRQGFGLAAVQRLAERGAGHLILFGRDVNAGTLPYLAGARVTYAAVDVSDAFAVQAFLRDWKGPPVRGVIHAASVWRNQSGQALVRPLDAMDADAFDAVLAPKARGAWALHNAFAGQDLDFFVMFSSAAALVGSAGQASYAAASSSLDALASLRRRQGLPALSINWGPIGDAGFGATPEGRRLHEMWESMGVRRIASADAVDIMESLIRDGRGHSAVMRIDWAVARNHFAGIASSPVFGNLIAREGTMQARTVFASELEARPAGERRQFILEHVRGHVAAVMELPAGATPDVDCGLFDYGLDSLMVLDLKNRLQASMGIDVPATLAFEHPTIRAIAAYFEGRFAPAVEPVNSLAIPSAAGIESILDRIGNLSETEAEHALRASGMSA